METVRETLANFMVELTSQKVKGLSSIEGLLIPLE